MIKFLGAALLMLTASPTIVWAQSNLFETVRQAAQGAAAVQDVDERPTAATRSRVPIETTDQAKARAKDTLYNDRAYQEMIDTAKNQNAKAASRQLPPTAAVPYRHTKQLCTGRGGKKAPCRIYR
jgi:hypothetical protein